MILIRKICMDQGRPVFEVMRWPASELDYWSVFYSIKPTDKPIIEQVDPKNVSVDESRSKFKLLFG